MLAKDDVNSMAVNLTEIVKLARIEDEIRFSKRGLHLGSSFIDE